MEPIVRREYVFVYFNTETDPENQPDSNFFKELYTLLDERLGNVCKDVHFCHYIYHQIQE